MIYKRMLEEYEQVKEELRNLEMRLKTFPKGNLSCTKNGKGFKWIVCEGKAKTYIPKRERAFAEQMAAKRYLSLRFKNLLREKQAIEAYLKYHDAEACQAEEQLVTSPGLQELLISNFQPISKELSNWMNAPYEKSTYLPEKLHQKTYSGISVRSKSEAMIADALARNQIPFRYECILHIGGKTIFPDFTIRHPRTGDFYYWEHFGLMDDKEYSEKAFSRIQHYNSNGVHPAIQLIMTFETKEHPLTSDVVEKLVKHYFA